MALKSFFTLLLSTIILLTGIAQTKPLSEVSVDLGSGVTTGALGLPYDVPFRLKGAVTANLRKINLTYEVSSSYTGKKSKLQWTSRGGAGDELEWEYAGDQTEWRFQVGPLHPNVPYTFKFKVTRVPDAKTPEKEKFKVESYKILESLFNNPAGISPTTVSGAESQINQQMAAIVPPGQTIEYPNGNPYIIHLTDPPFSDLVDVARTARNNRQLLIGRFTSLGNALSRSSFSDFQARLMLLMTNLSVLDPADKALMESLAHAANNKYKAVTMANVADIVKQPNHRIKETFEGTYTYNNGSLQASTAVDHDLLQLEINFFYKLINNLKKTDGTNYFSAADIAILRILTITFLDPIAVTQKNNQTEDEVIKQVLAKFPDVLADKLMSATYIVHDQSFIDAISQSSPYIGLDAGLSYIPGYNQLFIYEGVNFYFMPINKDAPLSYFHKRRYWWLKRLSIHFGVTQALIKPENRRYIDLIDGIGSIILGAGLRVNRIVRLNAGYIFFYEKDNNPLKDKKHLTIMPQLSLTFDINIVKALGNIGKRLAINP
ncbi:MAG: hypothetical protein EOO88_15155 [Pedobacter sp.]|nr:MAG: hypothetical protein EOO88_15155 [Pedobacter sp.]